MLLFRLRLKFNTFCFIRKSLFYNYITKKAFHLGTFELSSFGVSKTRGTTPSVCQRWLDKIIQKYPQIGL